VVFWFIPRSATSSNNLSSIIRQTGNTIIELNYFRYQFWFKILDVRSTVLGFWREWVGRIGGHAAKTGRFALFFTPGLKPRAIKSSTPLEFLRKVVLRKIGSWVEFILPVGVS